MASSEDAVQRLERASDKLRESVTSLRGQSPGAARDETVRQAERAIVDSQMALQELRTGAMGAGSTGSGAGSSSTSPSSTSPSTSSPSGSGLGTGSGSGTGTGTGTTR